MSAPRTPCIGICSTSVGDPVCRGCKRFNHEVFQWNGYTPSEKANVIQRLENLLDPIIHRYLTITHEKALDKQLSLAGTRP